MELRIDPELKAFVTPLSDMEKQNLENDILANGCREPLTVWDGMIIDGHNRYEICQKHNLPFRVREETFASKTEAMVWMHLNQTSRRNLNTVERVVMELKCKPLLIELGKQKQGCRKDLVFLLEEADSHNTRAIIARRARTSDNTVYKIEKIWEAADDGMKDALLTERVSVNKAYNQLFPRDKRGKTGRQKPAQESKTEQHDKKTENPEPDLKERLKEFSDMDLKLELFRRETDCITQEAVEYEYGRTFQPQPAREDLRVPGWKYDVYGTLNQIIWGFRQNILTLIDVTEERYLTDDIIDILFERLESVSEDAQELLDDELLYKLGDEYESIYADDE